MSTAALSLSLSTNEKILQLTRKSCERNKSGREKSNPERSKEKKKGVAGWKEMRAYDLLTTPVYCACMETH